MIIFDLDDTLIETSRCLTKPLLKRAYEAMVKGGFPAYESDLSSLYAENEHTLGSKDALRNFWEKRSQQAEYLAIGLESLYQNIPDGLEIEPVPGAQNILEKLSRGFELALVTLGRESLQLQKMEKAGIQQAVFSKLIVGAGPTKQPIYQDLLDERKIPPDRVVVCGDRVPIDLSPAKQLGMYTVHLPNGRGAVHNKPVEHVDRTIQKLEELEELLNVRHKI